MFNSGEQMYQSKSSDFSFEDEWSLNLKRIVEIARFSFLSYVYINFFVDSLDFAESNRFSYGLKVKSSFCLVYIGYLFSRYRDLVILYLDKIILSFFIVSNGS